MTISKICAIGLTLLMVLGSLTKPAFAISAIEAQAAHERASKVDHPRFFNGDPSGQRILNALRNERANGVKELLERAGRSAEKTLTAPAMLRGGTNPREAAQAVTQLNLEVDRLPEYALAWYLSRDTRWNTELLRRLDVSVTALEEVAGRKDYELVPLRNLVGAIALTLDIGVGAVPADLRARALSAIAAGVQRAKGDVLNNATKVIPDITGYHSLAILCGASVLLAGEFDGSSNFVRECLPAYLNRLSPFGGDDGGFFPGSSYAVWTMQTELIVLDIFRRVGGVDPYTLKWVQGFAEFIPYTVPPGAAAGAFGDGAEVRRTPEWRSFGHQLASRINTPLMRWYTANSPVDSWWASVLPMLLMPAESVGDSGVLPAKMADSKSFPSVGVAAMHSSLRDLERVSVLFRSSAFGAMGHAHADQNSFILTAGGEAVLIDSGVYDWYGSPHSVQWYRQTQAHNAVTYDGGKGQQWGRTAPGVAIRNFGDDGRVATVTGDATAAYGPEIRRAMRTLVFVRPNILLIYDILVAPDKRTWELNFHTKRSVLVKDPQTVTLKGTGGDVCISSLSGPELSIAVNKKYPVAPQLPPKEIEEESHIRFATSQALTEARFLSIVKFGCDLSLIEWKRRIDGVDVTLGSVTVSFGDDGGVNHRLK